MATATIMHGTRLEREAEHYLAGLGVTRLLPKLWESVSFEVSMGPQTGTRWTRRTVARRYLELLRDQTHASALETS